MLQRQHKESPKLQNHETLPFPIGSSSKSFQPTQHIYAQWQVKMQIRQTLNNGLKWYVSYVFPFCPKNIFTIHLYVPSIWSVFSNFPVQTAWGVQLGFSTQWIVYSNLTRIWLLLMNLCLFLRFKCFKFLILLTTWMDPKTQAN